MNRLDLMAVTLAALCFCSALGVAYAKHLSREAYTELGISQKAIDALDVQWSQLQIEASTFSELGRVERIAREQLDMSMPELDETVMIVR
jgi:cell division protein FtsL